MSYRSPEELYNEILLKAPPPKTVYSTMMIADLLFFYIYDEFYSGEVYSIETDIRPCRLNLESTQRPQNPRPISQDLINLALTISDRGNSVKEILEIFNVGRLLDSNLYISELDVAEALGNDEAIRHILSEYS